MTPPPFKAKAIYSWSGDDKSRDLGFIEDDIIEVLRVSPDQCTYYGKSLRTKLFGSFPARHVKVLHITESSSHPNVSQLRFSRNNSSSPSLLSTRSQYGDSPTGRSESNLSLSKLATRPKIPSPVPSSSPENSDTFSLKHQSYSYSDFEDQKEGSTGSSGSGSSGTNGDDLLKNLPPIPPKHTYDTPPKLRSSYSQQLLDSTLSTDTEKSSAFGHSDLSATSAGSYMRHKDSRRMSLLQNQEMFSRLFQDSDRNSSSARRSGFLRRFMGKSQKGPTLDEQIFHLGDEKLAELSLSESNTSLADSSGILDPEIGLERVKTITGKARAHRKSRAVDEDPELILAPHKFLTSLNKNEVVSDGSDGFSIDSTPLAHVDRYIDSLPPERSTILDKVVHDKIDDHFNTRLEKIRAIYTYLATRFELRHLPNEKLSTKVMPGSRNVRDLLDEGKCTPHQLTWLFFLMAQAIKLDAEIVLGHFKGPFEIDDSQTRQRDQGLLTLNHSWISVLIDGEYRLIDVSLGNPTNRVVSRELNVKSQSVLEENFDFYFLAKPLDLVYTHVPLHVDNQHIMPPLDPLAQLALPPLYPSFIENGLRLYKFNQALFRLHDYEVIDFDLEVPTDYEVTATVNPLDVSNFTPEECFVQPHWKNGRRLAKIKSTMPTNCPVGFVCCYGKSSAANEYSLLLSVPCFHRGRSGTMEWTRTSQLSPEKTSIEIYIKEPQVYNLALTNSYGFILKAFLNDLQKDADEALNSFRCMLVSPSGEFTAFDRLEDNIWEARKTLREEGEWRLVVPNEATGRWHVHAKWLCE